MTTTTEPAAPATAPPFSTVIRTASRDEHLTAEGTAFSQALVGGRLDRDAYVALLGQTLIVYAVLEDAAEAQRGDPVGRTFWFPELLRVPSIERDLDHLAGPGWRDGLAPLPATQRYVARLREVCFDRAGGFMAHQYTRYLGDLSGGQIISRVLRGAYGLQLDGLRFYAFDDIPKPKPFKDVYRARVDAAGWHPEEQAWILDEIKLAFRLNTQLFHDLGAAHLGATAR